MIRIVQQISGAFGAAVLAIILQQQLASHIAASITERATAFDHTFWWSEGFTTLALIPALLLGHSPHQNGAPDAASRGAA